MEVDVDKAKQDFEPREYQVEIVSRAIKENVIVFLPTGSGKTFIAVKLIEHFSEALKKSYSNGGSISFFLVNTVALVSQQAAAIRRLLPFNVGGYSGDMGVDYWDKVKWNEELEQHQIIVMTAQIFLDMIEHNYIHITRANVLIFDECHHAVNNHSMKQIMTHYKNIPNYSVLRPRIMGLTATLLNANTKPNRVPKEVELLESTFDATVVRAVNEKMVKQYSADPKEEIVYYEVPLALDIYSSISNSIKYLVNMLKIIKIPEENVVMPFEVPVGAIFCNSGAKKTTKKIKNYLLDIEFLNQELGLFATFKCLLGRIILFERLKISAPDILYSVFNIVTTELHRLRKEIQDYMEDIPLETKIHKFTTGKLMSLFNILKNFSPDDLAIVFVQRKITAQALGLVFKDLKESSPEFSNINSEFIVGFNAQPLQTRESMLGRKINNKILKKFHNKEINVLFASNVIEEGIDVRNCNLVIKFDEPETFRAYTQAKGRARHKDSRFIMLAPSTNTSNALFNKKYHNFKETEDILRDILCKVNEKYEFAEECDNDGSYFYSVGQSGAIVTGLTAISLLSRYCGSLPQDKFFKLTIHWWIKRKDDTERNETLYKAIIRLPINCPIKTLIEGPFRKNNISAKRMAALVACEMLHNIGELKDDLLPYGNESQFLLDSSLYPKFETDFNSVGPKAGSKKRKRLYERHFPSWMKGCKPVPTQETYIHVIEIVPNYSWPETLRLQAFYNLLASKKTFAILTNCQWPKMCDFPLFMNVGEVSVKLLENSGNIRLSNEEISLIENFHNFLFMDALPIVKKYVIRDDSNEEDSYLIIPVEMENNSVSIDWDTIKMKKFMPEIKPLPYGKRLQKKVTNKTYLNKVVIPWYRPRDTTLKYIVTKVCDNLNPNSAFPTNTYSSFSDYFKKRYDQQVYDVSQPLIEVRAISNKINCLLPRGKHKSKKKDDENFEETFIPELCNLLDFPSVYMVKITLMPSVLHRLYCLSLAEELRLTIARETGLGVSNLPQGFKWKKLEVDEVSSCLLDEDETPPADLNNILEPKLTNFDLEMTPWSETQEPADVDRDLDYLNMAAISYHHQFINTKEENLKIPETNYEIKRRVVLDTPLKVLNKTNDITPQLCELLTALTGSTSDDIINYERLETLGDSFLKFAASLSLFTYFKTIDEGKLTLIKGKIIGNANLFYCGKSFNLGSYLKVIPFSPSDWKVPGFTLPVPLKVALKDAKVSPSVLSKITISAEEQTKGKLLDLTNNKIIDLIFEANETTFTSEGFSEEPTSINSRDENLGSQIVSDKVIADSVEALICVYLQAFGLEGGFKLLNWLGVLPDKICDINKLLYSKPETAFISQDNTKHIHILHTSKAIEDSLGYTFQDKSFLIQALTHSSYSHNATDCFQRLEFLGDAILDFLITSYIYETCGKLTPGQVTDLRSALVNNVTFACLTVKYKFHQYLLSMGCSLSEAISKFVIYQESRNNEISSAVLYLIEETEVKVAESIDVPKILGDIFESLAAAVYLDSNRNLQTVWNIFYGLMENELKEFSKNVPLNALRLLYEKFPSPLPKFGTVSEIENGVIIPLEVDDKKGLTIFHGIGENKNKAKLAAAKLALRHFNHV